MPAPIKITRKIRESLTAGCSIEDALARIRSRSPKDFPMAPRFPTKHDYSRHGVSERRDFLSSQGISTQALSEGQKDYDPAELQGNIENFIGFAQIPVGIIGPLRVNGANAAGDFYVPMATTEGALIASYNRGSYAIGLAGGAAALCLTESVSRAPCFSFKSIAEAGKFLAWVIDQYDLFQQLVGKKSRHAQLLDLRTSLIGKDVYLIFEYSTGDASGQNMVTIVTNEICTFLAENSPVKPAQWYIEGNLSGDKKASMISFGYARGKKVIAEVELPKTVVSRVLHTTASSMHAYWEISFIGGSQSGSIGSQGHFANALAALFMACGQDVACVSEASVGITRMQVTEKGGLYVSVTLPNLIVGTVGGGTHLPTARECLQMLGCSGAGKARSFAEICAATALAGEISIIGALAAGDFVSAHESLGRKKS